jgi:Holliday junction DNA helicase RuvA
MINALKGHIIEKEMDSITLDVSGVGYKVFVTNEILAEINNTSSEEEVFLYTYLAVRETALDLYGFLTTEDKKLFQLLLTISGVGPKSAMNIMNSVNREMIEESISKDDPKYLSKISGIGKKTAEKILLGLKDKMGSIDPASSKSGSDNSVAIEALASLGYSERDARDAVKNIDTKDKDTQAIIKEALKNLGSN